MSNVEPVDFLQERRKRRPDEEMVLEKQPHGSPGERQGPIAPPLQSEPEQKQEPRCSCCGWSPEKVQVFLDLGQGRLLCDGCINICNEILREDGVAPGAAPPGSTHASRFSTRTTYHCSCCGKEQEQVARLIAMLNSLFICNTCVEICNACIAVL
ncbi:MAG: hypothetical protein H0V70_30300 [Ktedonobacteraceae bacterium]|nr:hypothetical protein [Ktedonobacteraceae bacterium]